MSKRLKGKTIIVTGGSSGIGESIACLFAQEGANVVILARREHEGLEVSNKINENGGVSTFIKCDVSIRENVDMAIESAAKKYGNLNVLVNNAGGGAPENFPNEGDEGWQRVIAINLSGTFYCSRAIWPHLISAGGGSIINISSVAAQRGFSKKMYELSPRAPSASYYAAKAGVDAFTRYIAGVGGQHNIRVNGIRPGQIITPLTDRGNGEHSLKGVFDFVQILDGPGYPKDVANAALFLVSEDGRFITGEILNVDGGMPAKL